jgi:hypothetical protein
MKSETDGSRPKRNLRRRAVGVICWFSPVFFLLVSLVVGLLNAQDNWLRIDRVIAIALLCLPLPFLNFYLSLIRPWLFESKVGYRNVSGIPLLGTFLVILAGAFAFGDWRVALIGLLALAIDTGGLPWVLIATWRDTSFWDS